jgi:hypothetical protein
MMKTILLATAMISVAACGDDLKQPDAPHSIDAPPVDSANVPPPPMLGAQIDRMGRPAINTALNHVLDTNTTTKTAAKDTYNQDQATGSWASSYTPEFAKNLAVFDALDKGLLPATKGLTAASKTFHCSTTVATACQTSGDCPTSETCVGNACGNQAEYNGMAGGQVGFPVQCFSGSNYQMNCSYGPLAGILADDQLYLDTGKPRCKAYLAVEFSVVTSMPNTDCGGRAPDNDVMDTSYSVLAAGIAGFDLTMDPPAPLFGDNVPAHTDYTLTTFPFFGPPH